VQTDIESLVRDQLSAGEHLLWSGKPKSGLRLRASDVLMIPFSLMWGGFAVFWEWSVVTSGAPFFFKLWGIPFVLVGLYLIIGRFFFDAHQRANAYYGISNQRVLIVTRGLGGRVKSLSLRTLSDVTLSSASGGTGSIQFGSSPWGAASWFGSSGWPGAQTVPAFDSIDDAKQVYDILRQAQQKAS